MCVRIAETKDRAEPGIVGSRSAKGSDDRWERAAVVEEAGAGGSLEIEAFSSDRVEGEEGEVSTTGTEEEGKFGVANVFLA